MIKVGIIGFGAIGQCVIETLPKALTKEYEVIGILTRKATDNLVNNIPSFRDIDQLLALQPDIIVECAGHHAVKEYGCKILQANISLVISSIGALADSDLYQKLKDASTASQAKIYLPAGAIGGIDALVAAKLGGINNVTYTMRKPPNAWQGTVAETVVNLNSLKQATVIFSGSAGKAATLYPKNTNVTATIALAGLGFEETKVELIADPNISDNIHEISVSGKTGDFTIVLTGKPSVYNPKTSALTAFSVTKCVADFCSSIII
ncbi:MAG: aspartate dehydrogenase [Flavobacteriales bacterium]|jgi:aspartate dehydrogenase